MSALTARLSVRIYDRIEAESRDRIVGHSLRLLLKLHVAGSPVLGSARNQFFRRMHTEGDR